VCSDPVLRPHHERGQRAPVGVTGICHTDGWMEPASLVVSVLGLVGQAAVTRAASAAVEEATQTRRKQKDLKAAAAQAEQDIARAWEQHLVEAANWAATFKPPGASMPLQTASTTLALFHGAPKHARPSGQRAVAFGERDLLTPGQHTLLLGGAGAGKTTTVRRLVHELLSPTDDRPVLGFVPLLVAAREQDWSTTRLAELLCRILGLHADAGRELAVVAAVLKHTSTVLFVDGLDEVGHNRGRDRLHNDLRQLSRSLSGGSFVVATSRPGEHPHFDNFRSLEILALSRSQVAAAAHHQLGDRGDAFVEALSASPLRDTGRRPLLLQQLLTVYMREGSLPKRPSTLYSTLTRLLLSEWDRGRDVARPSRYAGFDTEEKKKFLSDLAYELTIAHRIRFSTADLEAAYGKISAAYDLPAGDAGRVAREIESHNGLVVEAGDGYEFAHLALQEYLCADYLSRTHDADLLGEYIESYPAPVAIAVALAANPSDWLANIVLRRKTFRDRKGVRTFVQRLGEENPPFKVTIGLGRALLDLMGRTDADDAWAFAGLAVHHAAVDAIREALKEYDQEPGNRGVRLVFIGAKPAGRRRIPDPVGIDAAVWETVLTDMHT
jgi:hypothetical protein